MKRMVLKLRKDDTKSFRVTFVVVTHYLLVLGIPYRISSKCFPSSAQGGFRA